MDTDGIGGAEISEAEVVAGSFFLVMVHDNFKMVLFPLKVIWRCFRITSISICIFFFYFFIWSFFFFYKFLFTGCC